MKETWKAMGRRYGSVILYLFFGGCTTVLNVCLYYGFRHLAGYSLNGSNIAAWAGAVLFAYVTNRKWVFGSRAKGALPVAREMGRFFACRLATGILDVGFMYLTVTLCGWNDVVMKVVSNGIVILVNYAASKLIIFRRDKAPAVGLYIVLTVCAVTLFPAQAAAAGEGIKGAAATETAADAETTENPETAADAQTAESTKDAGNRENAVEGAVMTVHTQTDIFKDTGKTEMAGRLDAGELIFVTGEEGDWLRFLYHGEDAYIEEKYVTKPAENTALLEEMETHEEAAGRDLEQYLESQDQDKGRLVWGIVIGVLIVLLFLTGLWSLKPGGKKKRKKKMRRP